MNTQSLSHDSSAARRIQGSPWCASAQHKLCIVHVKQFAIVCGVNQLACSIAG